VVATNSCQLKVFELLTNSCQILYGHTGQWFLATTGGQQSMVMVSGRWMMQYMLKLCRLLGILRMNFRWVALSHMQHTNVDNPNLTCRRRLDVTQKLWSASCNNGSPLYNPMLTVINYLRN
jgi:hypothetical protein